MRARIAEDIGDTILGVKRMIRGLLPPELDRRGLSSALGSAFRDIEDVYGFEVHASLIGVGGELDQVAKLALYRIVPGAVGNAVKHAGVNEATVTVESANGAGHGHHPGRGMRVRVVRSGRVVRRLRGSVRDAREGGARRRRRRGADLAGRGNDHPRLHFRPKWCRTSRMRNRRRW